MQACHTTYAAQHSERSGAFSGYRASGWQRQSHKVTPAASNTAVHDGSAVCCCVSERMEIAF